MAYFFNDMFVEINMMYYAKKVILLISKIVQKYKNKEEALRIITLFIMTKGKIFTIKVPKRTIYSTIQTAENSITAKKKIW